MMNQGRRVRGEQTLRRASSAYARASETDAVVMRIGDDVNQVVWGRACYVVRL